MSEPKPEMIERARNLVAGIMADATPHTSGNFQKDCDDWPKQGITSDDLIARIAAFASQIRQETARELQPYLIHKADCAVAMKRRHRFENRETGKAYWKELPCDCGLKAIRQRFGVED